MGILCARAAFETFSHWIENSDDENPATGLLRQSDGRSSWVTFERQDDACLFYNYGTGYFTTTLEHHFDMNVTNIDAGDASSGSLIRAYMLANTFSVPAIPTDAIQFVVQQIGADNTQYRIYFGITDGGATSWSTLDNGGAPYSFQVDTEYYFNITRAAGTAYATAYSNYVGGTEVAAANDTDSADTFRYALIPWGKVWAGDPLDDSSGYVENFDINIPEAPSIIYMGLNSTLNNQTGVFTFNLTDDVGLSHLVFSWNNSGTMTNYTSAISGSNIIANYTGTINETVGYIVEYQAFVNDTSGLWRSTILHYFEVNDPAKAEFLGYLILVPIFLVVIGVLIYAYSKR